VEFRGMSPEALKRMIAMSSGGLAGLGPDFKMFL